MKPMRWLTRINMGIKVVDGESPVCFQKLAPKLKVLIAGFKLLLILMYQVLGWVEIGVLKSTDAFRSFTAFLEKSCSNGNNISLNLRCHWLWDISIPIPYVFQRKINGCKLTYNTMFLINSNFYCMLLKELWMTYLNSFFKEILIYYPFAYFERESIPKTSLHSEFRPFESLLTDNHQSFCSSTQDRSPLCQRKCWWCRISLKRVFTCCLQSYLSGHWYPSPSFDAVTFLTAPDVNQKLKQATKKEFISLPQMVLTCFCLFVLGRDITELLLPPGITTKFTCTINENNVIIAAWPQWF